MFESVVWFPVALPHSVGCLNVPRLAVRSGGGSDRAMPGIRELSDEFGILPVPHSKAPLSCRCWYPTCPPIQQQSCSSRRGATGKRKTMHACRSCGKEVAPAALFCGACGTRIEAATVTATPTPLALPGTPDALRLPAALAAAHKRARFVGGLMLACLAMSVIDAVGFVPQGIEQLWQQFRFWTTLAAFIAWLRWSAAACQALSFMGDGSRKLAELRSHGSSHF